MREEIEKDLIKFIEHYEQHRETYKKWTPEQIAKTSIKNIFTSLPTQSPSLICKYCNKYKTLQGDGVLHQLCECHEPPSLVSEISDDDISKALHKHQNKANHWEDALYSHDATISAFKELLSTLLVKEGEKDSEDLAFGDWLLKKCGNHNSTWIYEWKFKTTSELYQIFKQEQQKTGNNG